MGMNRGLWFYVLRGGILITAIIGLIQILSYTASVFRTPEKSLVTEVFFGMYRTPPSLQQPLHELGMTVVFQQRALVGYWSAKVCNSGSKVLRDIRLSLPDADEAWIEYRGSTDSVHCTASTIYLSELQPREYAYVYAFTKYVVPNQYDKGKIQLTHAEGIGKVKLFVPCGRLGQWIDSPFNQFFLLTCALGLIFLVLVLRDSHYQRRFSSTESQESTNSTKQPPNAGSEG